MVIRIGPLGVLTLMVMLLTPGSLASEVCDDPLYRALDFWVGEWRVVDADGVVQGHNRIEKILAGCAVLEHWTAAGGSEGKSLFYVDPAKGRWNQVWVTESAGSPGGTKEKAHIETLSDGAVRFQGTIVLADGREVLDRTTLTPLPDGRVRQHIQNSGDGGETWTAGWVGFYERVG